MFKMKALINIWQEVEDLNTMSSRQCWAPEPSEVNSSNKTQQKISHLSLTAGTEEQLSASNYQYQTVILLLFVSSQY